MKDLLTDLKDNFTVVNLGCIGDADFLLPRKFLKTLTIVEIDAEGGAVTGDRYHKKISIQKPISGRPGRHVFRRNNFAGTCSLLEPLDGVVEMWGMENYCRLIERNEVECETIPQLLESQKIKTLDFLKTDIEGLDPEIIRSCENYLGKTHFIQCELRFRPFYQSEPYFQDTVNLLARHGYEVLDILHVDRWRYKTSNRPFQAQGRAVWADFLFVLQPERLAGNFGEKLPEAVAKQVILACMLGKKNYGEFLLHKFKNSLPENWFQELEPLTRPSLPGVRPLLASLRRMFHPMEIFLKHRIGRSEFVAVR
ncbi:MAG TPA: FkbM family methyltransferase [Verrucomicrobiae bacterium]|jgi:FkbM family methyltransferase